MEGGREAVEEKPVEGEVEAEEEGEPLPPSRFFLVSVKGGMEVKVAAMIMERARALGLDIRSVIVPYSLKGYIVIEAGDPGDVYTAVRRIKDVKRVRLADMSVDEVINLVKPPETRALKLSKGQMVEIVSGPFKGFRARIIDVNERKGEVTITLQDVNLRGGSTITVTIPIDDVRPVESEEAGG